MRARVALTVMTLGLTLAVTAAPVVAGGGSLAIGNGGADGELAVGVRSVNGGEWMGEDFCRTGALTEPPTEFRFAVEFPLAGLPTGASITHASLSLFTTRHDLAQQTAIYGYPGNGLISVADMQITGTPVLFTPTLSTAREAHDVTALLTADVLTAGWAGFSLRQEPLGTNPADWDCPDLGTYPILTIQYDLPNTPVPVASLASTALADPKTGSPVVALGIVSLLIGSLGALAMVNVRGAVSRS